jgi:1,4-alpha-glucan branching enzyme
MPKGSAFSSTGCRRTFPNDVHGLVRFDGTPLYEHADPREGFHQDWNTLIYNFGRTEVRNFLVANALFWVERYGVDGLRVDAVASMLYRDYSRKAGEWVPNIHGGRENLEAIAFLKRMNEVGRRRAAAGDARSPRNRPPSRRLAARPSRRASASLQVEHGLDARHAAVHGARPDPPRHHHGRDDVLAGLCVQRELRAAALARRGRARQGLAARQDAGRPLAEVRQPARLLRLHVRPPGKKLLFMGCEFAQESEWNHERSLDWHLLDRPEHQGVQRLVRDLNRLHRETAALHECDVTPDGFEWIDHGDAERSVLAFVRRGRSAESFVVVVCNFTPVPHAQYRIGVPRPGVYRERINTDSTYYGGSNVGTPYGEVTAEAVPWHGRPQSIALTLPPLATVFFEWKV